MFSCLLKQIKLPLIMKTENNFVTFKGLSEKSAFLKTAAQAFEAGDFLNIFIRFWGF